MEIDPLRITLSDSTILMSYIVSPTRDVVSPTATTDDKNTEARVIFDFLDPGDGFAVAILHCGSAGSAKILGTLRGVKEGPRRLRHNRLVTLLTPIAGMGLVGAAVSSIPSIRGIAGGSAWVSALTIGALLGLIVIQAASPALLRRQRMKSFPKEMRKHPKLSGILPHLLDNT